MEQLDETSSILFLFIEHYLEVGRHRQNLVHTRPLPRWEGSFYLNAHQREQPIEIGIMSETKVSTLSSTSNHGIGISLDAPPKRDG